MWPAIPFTLPCKSRAMACLNEIEQISGFLETIQWRLGLRGFVGLIINLLNLKFFKLNLCFNRIFLVSY